MTMKKVLLATVMALCMSAMAVSAAPYRRANAGGTCSYSPLQDLIRNARSGQDLQPILGGRVDLDAPVKCGGTILQLAIRRGNPEVVKLLLENGVSVKEEVSLNDFSIEGAPNKVPLLMFAAYYSPRQDILNLIISAGADMTALDSNGENVLWYLDKNPVLQNTAISDSIKNALLFNLQPQAAKQNNNVGTAPIQPAQNMGMKNGQAIPAAQPAPQIIISKQPDGSVGVPAEVLQAITAASAAEGNIIQPTVQKPTEIVEPSMPIK
jgi:hypothetical protein